MHVLVNSRFTKNPSTWSWLTPSFHDRGVTPSPIIEPKIKNANTRLAALRQFYTAGCLQDCLIYHETNMNLACLKADTFLLPTQTGWNLVQLSHGPPSPEQHCHWTISCSPVELYRVGAVRHSPRCTPAIQSRCPEPPLLPPPSTSPPAMPRAPASTELVPSGANHKLLTASRLMETCFYLPPPPPAQPIGLHVGSNCLRSQCPAVGLFGFAYYCWW
jgi:hypothetical protein